MSAHIDRPFSVTIIIWLVLIIAVSNLIRLVRTVFQWDFLLGLIDVHPAYLIVSGLVWGIVGIVLVWGLWKAREWAFYALRWGAALYIIYIWFDRLFISSPSVRNTNNLFVSVVSLLLIGWILWVFARRDVKLYFGVIDE